MKLAPPRDRHREPDFYERFRHSSVRLPLTAEGFNRKPLRRPFRRGFLRGMKTVSVLHVTLGVVVALFVIQMVRRLTAQSQNPIAQGVTDGLGFLTS